MLKQTIEDGIGLATQQQVILDIKSVVPVEANAVSKKVASLISAETLAFQTVFESNSQLLRQRLKSNSESAKQFSKVSINVPNLVLNSFNRFKQDSLPLTIAMIAQVYHQIEQHTDELSKALKDNSSTSEIVKSINAQNPIEKNYFFLPYQLVRTLLNFDSIDDDYEASKFIRATREIRELSLPLFFNREEHKTNGDQYVLLTSMVGKMEGLTQETINVQAFENCFYWLHDKKEYFGFTIAPDFRNLLLMLMSEIKDGSKLRQILPYTRVDWHFLHFLPQRNNLRQMYLFIKSNIYNASNLQITSASFEYSIDDLKRLMDVDEKSHYAMNDSHFVRDKIRKVITELEKTPGCEYNITITKRNIKTPGGSKQQMIKFNVEIKSSFTFARDQIIRHLKKIAKVSNFKNDWLIFSCIRYCSEEQLCARIDKAYGKFVGLQKKVGESKKYDHLTIENQVSRFISDDLQKYWQELAADMIVENPLSSQSRTLKKVIGNQTSTKIYSSQAAQIIQAKKRGRPSKNKTVNELPPMSAKERKIYDALNKKMAEEKLASADVVPTEDIVKTPKAQIGEVVQDVETTKTVQQDLLSQNNVVDENILIFPSSHEETDFRVGVPANFTPPPIDMMDSSWEGYSELDVVAQEVVEDSNIQQFDETFLVTVDNIQQHLLPVNGNYDHFAWVQDYIENITAKDKTESNAIFYEIFNLTAILNEIEFENPQFKSRSVKYIDLYREKLNIVLQTLYKFYGMYDQRQDQASLQTMVVEKTAEILFESADLSGNQRLFTRGLFVLLAKAVEEAGMVSKMTLFSLRGQCVAYPFT